MDWMNVSLVFVFDFFFFSFCFSVTWSVWFFRIVKATKWWESKVLHFINENNIVILWVFGRSCDGRLRCVMSAQLIAFDAFIFCQNTHAHSVEQSGLQFCWKITKIIDQKLQLVSTIISEKLRKLKRTSSFRWPTQNVQMFRFQLWEHFLLLTFLKLFHFTSKNCSLSFCTDWMNVPNGSATTN